VTPRTWEALAPPLRERIEALVEEERAIMAANPSLEADVLNTIRRELLRAERSALIGLQREGVISDEVYGGLAMRVDAALEGDDVPENLDADERDKPQ